MTTKRIDLRLLEQSVTEHEEALQRALANAAFHEAQSKAQRKSASECRKALAELKYSIHILEGRF